MTADGWCSTGGTVCTKPTASTALVLWNYNIALEPKCMLLEVAPLLCTGVFGIVFYLFEDLEWFYCVKKQTKNMGNVFCVWDSVNGACVFVYHFGSCSQTYIHTPLDGLKHTSSVDYFPRTIWTHTSLLYIWRAQWCKVKGISMCTQVASLLR